MGTLQGNPGATIANQESGNPFHLLPSDNPGINLVSKVLNGDNYPTWSRAMRMTLGAKDKLCFVDGSVEIPSKQLSPKEYAKWSRANDMVMSWILSSLDPELVDSVIYYNTAEEMWKDLQDRFSQSNLPRIFQLKRTVASLNQDNYSVRDYFSKLKSLWDELSTHTTTPTCRCGGCKCGFMKEVHEKEQQDKTLQFLLGLNETFSGIRGQILLSTPLPPVTKVYSLILQEEKQREVGGSNHSLQDATALATGRGNNYNNQINNHKQSNQNNQTFKEERPTCTNCKKVGHTAEKCYWIIGFPKKTNNQKNKKISAKEKVDGSRVSSAENQVGDSNITKEQYNQILQILKSKENMVQVNAANSGYCQEEDDWYG